MSMTGRERFYATIERRKVGPSGVMAGPCPVTGAEARLKEYFQVDSIGELKLPAWG